MPATKLKPNAAGALADELGALEVEMAPHASKLARIDALRKGLRAACVARADEQWTVEGTRYTAVLGACGIQRVINLPKLVKTITAAAFAKFATCTLKDLEANVAPDVVLATVSEEQIGSRSLKTFAR